MGPLDFLILLLIAGLCGGIGQRLAGHSHAGCLGSIALGFIGALLGMWIARGLGLPEMFSLDMGDGATFPVIWSIIGAALFVALLGLISNRPRK